MANTIAMSNTAPITALPALVSIERVRASYPDLPLRTVRRWIAEGKLPAVRAGRSYLVRLADVEAMLTPVAAVRAPRERRTPAQRVADQLAGAGIAPLGVASIGKVTA